MSKVSVSDVDVNDTKEDCTETHLKRAYVNNVAKHASKDIQHPTYVTIDKVNFFSFVEVSCAPIKTAKLVR